MWWPGKAHTAHNKHSHTHTHTEMRGAGPGAGHAGGTAVTRAHRPRGPAQAVSVMRGIPHAASARSAVPSRPRAASSHKHACLCWISTGDTELAGRSLHLRRRDAEACRDRDRDRRANFRSVHCPAVSARTRAGAADAARRWLPGLLPPPCMATAGPGGEAHTLHRPRPLSCAFCTGFRETFTPKAGFSTSCCGWRV